MRKSLESKFESLIWQARWSILAAVFCSGATALAMFYVAAVDAYYVIERLLDYATLTDPYERMSVRSISIGNVVEVVDGFLLAIVLLIFAFGLYELYISKIDSAYEEEASAHMLAIDSLDDLKSRLGKVILMILIVKFFELAISMEFETVYDLLMFSGGIVLVGGSLFLTEFVTGGQSQNKNHDPDREVWTPEKRAEKMEEMRTQMKEEAKKELLNEMK
ncbi:MAG: YqhA family protein [Mariprofundaceae bacterium]